MGNIYQGKALEYLEGEPITSLLSTIKKFPNYWKKPREIWEKEYGTPTKLDAQKVELENPPDLNLKFQFLNQQQYEEKIAKERQERQERWRQDYGAPKKVEGHNSNKDISQLNLPQPPTLDTSKLTLPTTQQLSGFQKGWQKVNKFMNSKGAQIGMQALGVGMNFLGDNDKDINSWDTATKQLRNGIADSMLASGNPWLMAGALGIKGFGKLGAFGDSTKGLGAGNDILNTVGSFVPGVGWVAGKSKEIQKDENVLASSSFTGVADDVNNAAQNAGGKFLFGMDKANRRIDRANLAQNQASQILDDNRLAKQSSNHPLYQMRTQMLTSGGYNPTSTYAKMGAKLYNIEEAKRILNNRLQSFKNGGAVNVIPDGALHKNRHHLEDIDEKFEDVTTKGIPVITEAKNGDIIQQAEVEKEEIIFNLAVTKKLEELMEKGTDEAAIEAGKLLTEEILRNTIDNTNKLL